MYSAPLQAPVSATALTFAPEFACRVGLIVADLVVLIAARFREPRIGALVVPLCARLRRCARRFARLLARVAAGKPAQRRSPQPGPPPSTETSTPETQPPETQPIETPPPEAPPALARPRYPTGRAWLVVALGSEAAIRGVRLEMLLAEPAAVELIAAVPAVGCLLRPLCRMLGVDALAIPRQRPAADRPAKPSVAPPPVTPPPALPPKPPLPLNAPAWLRESRPSIVLPFLRVAKPT